MLLIIYLNLPLLVPTVLSAHLKSWKTKHSSVVLYILQRTPLPPEKNKLFLQPSLEPVNTY